MGRYHEQEYSPYILAASTNKKFEVENSLSENNPDNFPRSRLKCS
jgi:hypothetical protein